MEPNIQKLQEVHRHLAAIAAFLDDQGWHFHAYPRQIVPRYCWSCALLCFIHRMYHLWVKKLLPGFSRAIQRPEAEEYVRCLAFALFHKEKVRTLVRGKVKLLVYATKLIAHSYEEQLFAAPLNPVRLHHLVKAFCQEYERLTTQLDEWLKANPRKNPLAF